jgi:hypothetical protein
MSLVVLLAKLLPQPHATCPNHRFLPRDRVLANRFRIPANRWSYAIDNPRVTPAFCNTVRRFVVSVLPTASSGWVVDLRRIVDAGE